MAEEQPTVAMLHRSAEEQDVRASTMALWFCVVLDGAVRIMTLTGLSLLRMALVQV